MTGSRQYRLPRRVLVLSSTSSTLLSDALRQKGHEVTLLVPAATVHERRQQTSGPVFGVQRWTDQGALSRLAERAAPVDAVATVDEETIVPAALIRELLGLPGLSLRTAKAFRDKHLMKAHLIHNGLPTAAHRIVRHAHQIPDAAKALGWPLVVKPRAGAAAIHTFVLRNLDDLRHLIAEGAFDTRATDPVGAFAGSDLLQSLHESRDGFIVERKIDAAAEFFVDLYRFGGRTLFAAPGRYSSPLLDAMRTHAVDTLLRPEDPDVAEVTRLAEQAATALGLHTGVAHVEIMQTHGGSLIVGEAAARPGGGGLWQLYARMYGLNVPAVLADLAVGRRPSSFAPSRQYPYLSSLLLTPAAGTVISMATVDELMCLPGVVDVDLHLTVGQSVPASLGSLSFAGRIAFSSEHLDNVHFDAESVLRTLSLRVSPGAAAA